LKQRLTIPLFHDLRSLPVSSYNVWSVTTAHNFTSLKCDNSRLHITRVHPGKKRRRSRPWNK